ncbi:putative conjugal transfer protein TraH [Candidatus Megaera venefica]|uniref:Conjugal transfer protein TraH n=1 Tax=Candidatus Megaera venefica TaxID=2055910 RepID=A0ABU5NDM2_9RICK|nr:AAA family ATPase [Candidatus Megaera venefica]MEA0971258.1 putative conjugal transfer protein TraH [Candidatus Megaera venefica]
MAIAFAHPEYVSRSSGANACCKSAYNARDKIKDLKTGVVYNWQRRSDNVYHDIMLPDYVDKKFKNAAVLANEVEKIEKRKDSQLYVEWLLALPKETNVSLELKLEMVHEFINRKGWIKEGLGVQVDIHKPHGDDINWHAHLLVTTRRFAENGKEFSDRKATDLQPEVKYGKVQKTPEIDNNIFWRDVQNDKFKEYGMSNRVDLNGEITQEHIGPIRMRSVLNEAVIRNEERKFANIELLKTGADVIARVTKHASIFTEKDLERAVKCIPNHEKAASLVLEALNSDQIMPLYHKGGGESGFYTITEVRDEELKLVRLGGYIANQKNLILNSTGTELSTISKIISEDRSLNTQQSGALSHLLLASGGLRILRGRAGTGKSHVLGKLLSIASYSRVNVIGLAPTHKAKQELEQVGYKTCDTIKGFLFKLHNNRADLPKGSLIVIDEAGMVGNDDYCELLRVAASRSCNVILAGDERQLSSVSRGGMFEVFADEFGSCEMNDIKRQELEWGKDVALSFSNGDIRGGINILKSNNRLYSATTTIDSAEQLLNNWNDSSEGVRHRLIIAVKNTDVDTLNAGARELLKAKNILSGTEISITKDAKDFFFMKNDRIVFNQSNKELNLSNGDFGNLEAVSSTKFVVKLDQGREVEFNPSEFSGFKHGYASTVYKAQGSSIRDVYVLHDGFSTNRNSYVAMSRHIKDIHLYTNKLATKTDDHLIGQLGFNPEAGSSINYLTREDLEAKKTLENKGLLAKTYGKVSSKFKEQITSFVDKNKIDAGYYVFEKSEVSKAEVEEILDLVHEYRSNTLNINQDHINENVLELEERAVVGGYNIKQSTGLHNTSKVQNNIAFKSSGDASNVNSSVLEQNLQLKSNITEGKKQRSTPKERFYASREYLQNKARTQKINYEQEDIKLRQEVNISAERIARDLLGEPNKHLSNGTNLRFGSGGSFIVKITGEKRGTWYDFKEGKGGDLFDLVQEKQNCDFKEAANYLRGIVGISGSSVLKLVYDHESKDRYVDHYKQATSSSSIEDAKVKKAENLYSRAKVIEHNSTAYKYLANARGITCDLASDIKTADIFDKDLGKKLPTIIAFARDDSGNITGGQQLLLDRRTNNKATVSSPRKSFGKIAGSFVEISNSNQQSRHDNITIIAEGLETALSIKQAGIGIDAKIICALGISNIKNYIPKENERVIIAADNDGEASITSRITAEASNVLRMRGATVRIVSPSEIGDFNDILQKDKVRGASDIKDIFNPVISSLKAKTLNEFFANPKELDKLSSEAQKDLAYVSKYNINEDKLLNSFKYSVARGVDELSGTKGGVMYAERSYHNHIEVIEDIRTFGGEFNPKQLIGELSNKPKGGHLNYLNELCNDALHSYITNHRNLFNKEKEQATNPNKLFDVVAKEQQLFVSLKENHKHAMIHYAFKDYKVCEAAKIMQEQPTLLQDTKKIIVEAQKEGSMTDLEIMRTLKSTINIEDIHTTLDKRLENHYIRTNLESFKVSKLASNSPQEMIAIIKKEQDFMSGLHENIKYPDEQKDIRELIDLAYAQKSDQVVKKLDISIRCALTSGIKTSDEIVSELKNSGDFKSTYIALEKALEIHHVQTNLSNFAQEKLEAKLPEEIISVLSKEQSFLAELKGNLQYKDIHSLSLLDSINKAYAVKDGNIIPLLQKAVNVVIETSFKDLGVIVDELQKTTDVKNTYIHLDQGLEAHNIKSTLNKFTIAKLEAKLPEELMTLFTEEQRYLAELNDTIKYPDQHSKTLLNKVAEARIGQQDNIVSVLRKTVDDSIEAGLKDSSTIVEELKNASGLKSAYVNLDRELENRLVQTNLNSFSRQKAQARTLPEVLQITNEQQEFLASLHNTIKYPEEHSQSLLNSIEKAHSGQQDNVMQELYNVMTHITKHKIIPEQDLLQQLKNSEDTHATIKELTKSAVEHHGSFVNTNINRLIKHERLKMGDTIFDCPMKYLNHEIANPAHAYADIAVYKKSIPRLQEIMNKLEFKKEHEHSMGGMSM